VGHGVGGQSHGIHPLVGGGAIGRVVGGQDSIILVLFSSVILAAVVASLGQEQLHCREVGQSVVGHSSRVVFEHLP